MAKVITFSRTFPAYHPRAGQPTCFVEQVLNSLGIDYTSEEYFQFLISSNPNVDELRIIEFHVSLEVLKDDPEKPHTIRAKSIDKKTGETYSRWNQGDKASLRVWSDTPYNSPQIIFAPEVELVKVGGFQIASKDYLIIYKDGFRENRDETGNIFYPSNPLTECLAKNDGLSTEDFLAWFKYPKPFEGQILCWKEVGYV